MTILLGGRKLDNPHRFKLSVQEERPENRTECRQIQLQRKYPLLTHRLYEKTANGCTFSHPRYCWWLLWINSFQLWFTNSVFNMFFLNPLASQVKIFAGRGDDNIPLASN